jgi:hypothetical protein
MPYDCTFVVPTVGPSSNQVYDEVVAAILINQSLLVIFSTITDPAAQPDNATEEMDDTDGTMGTPLPSSVRGTSAFICLGCLYLHFLWSLQRASLGRSAIVYIQTVFPYLFGSTGHTFMVCIHTENQNQGDFYPFALLKISVLHESPIGHLRYGLTDVPPRPNPSPDDVFNPGRPTKDFNARSWTVKSNRLICFQNCQPARQRHRGDG